MAICPALNELMYCITDRCDWRQKHVVKLRPDVQLLGIKLACLTVLVRVLWITSNTVLCPQHHSSLQNPTYFFPFRSSSKSCPRLQ